MRAKKLAAAILNSLMCRGFLPGTASVQDDGLTRVLRAVAVG
jgi:hypothetical protein